MDIPLPKELLNFTGKTVIVTGASQGIGAGIARRFAQAGAKVVIHYRRGSQTANGLVNQLVGAGGEAIAIAAELTNGAAAEADAVAHQQREHHHQRGPHVPVAPEPTHLLPFGECLTEVGPEDESLSAYSREDE